MNFKLLAVAASLVLASQASFAAGGTVEINGTLTDSACKVSTQDQNKSVTLDNVDISKIYFNTLTAKKPFSIGLTCASNSGRVAAHFITSQKVSGDGNLVSDGSANNIEIALLNNDQGVESRLKVNATDATSSGTEFIQTGTNVTLNYLAAYTASSETGVVTAGNVHGNYTYDLEYQ